MATFSENDVHKHLHAEGLEAVIADCPEFDAPEAEQLTVSRIPSFSLIPL